MITVDEEVLRQALEFIKVTNARSEFWLVPGSNLNKTVNALRAALEQPEQEPVACSNTFACRCPKHYTHPPRREWRGLTDEQEIANCWHGTPCNADLKTRVFAFARAIEALLKEKNHER